MQAISITAPHKLELIDLTPREPGPGEVRIRFLQGGICGSDLSAYTGTSPMIVYPRIIGHEVVGRVVAAGEGAAKWMDTLVVVEPLLACSTCYACRKGRYNTCVNLKVLGVHVDGGFQEEFVVPAANVHPLPTGMDLDTATLAEPLTIATQALLRSSVSADEKVLIFGAGPIGLLALQVATSYLGASVLVVDIREDRLSLAERLGADATVNVSGWNDPGSTSPELLRAVREWSDGDMAHVVVEATGHPASTTSAIDCLAHAGRITLVGWNEKPITVDTIQLMRKEASLYGSRNSCQVFPRALEILAGGHIDVDAMITHRLRMDQADKGLEIMRDPRQQALKVVLTA